MLSPPGRDVYANLLRDTRGMRRDQALAREAWYASLRWDRKEAALFELEMLLKGIACFGNPRNHAGPPRRTPGVAHDFRNELHILRATLDRCVHLIRGLLGDKDRAFSFARYLETVIPEDAARSQLVKDQLTQDTPVEALFVLRNAFTEAMEIAGGLMRLERINHRVFHAYHGMLTREIGRNAYFNPLVTLEFRSEFDRIRNPAVLEALEHVPTDCAHRVVALTLLTLYRAGRYLELIDRIASGDTPHDPLLVYIVLAVFRSDVRALTRYLQQGAADSMADGLERDLLQVSAENLRTHFEELAAVASTVISLRGALEALGGSLRIDVRRCFERELSPVGREAGGRGLLPEVVVATASLRASIHHGIQMVCLELCPGEEPPQLAAPDSASRRAASERLRRDVWIFSQILRAFLSKAHAAPRGDDSWEARASFAFVRDFLRHFRAIGYQLLRSSDYARMNPFLDALDALRAVDLLEPEQLRLALDECQEFFLYLEEIFAKVSRRAELKRAPFDKKVATQTLKLYLGAA